MIRAAVVSTWRVVHPDRPDRRQQGRVNMFRNCLVVVVGLGLVGTARAGSWADGMFEELSKDFGSVPRGPVLNHPFHLTNNTGVPVHISSISVSCGCVTATARDSYLAPGQKTVISADMRSNIFSGSKTVTIYVRFDRPQSEEVRLWVSANSRDDVTVSPDAFAFGQIKRGSEPSGAVTVTFLGGNVWDVTDVQCDSNYVKAQARMVRRDMGDVAYQVSAQLRKDAPVGKWYTDIWLKTNNPSSPRVRVPLTVEIESALTISPALVDLGQLKVGGQIERKVIVRGVKPFRVTEVTGGDDQLKVRDTTSESKPVHVLAVTLHPSKAGEITRSLRVQTDLEDEGEIEFQAKAQVVGNDR
jgi:hypothetical protein